MAACTFSWKKKDVSPEPPPVLAIPDTTTIIGAAAYTTGVENSYDLMKNNSAYAALVKDQFDRVTFEYLMKHGPIVLNEGSFNFTNTNELINIAQSAGLDIYGPTLVWHQNNNGTYLRSLTGSGGRIFYLTQGLIMILETVPHRFSAKQV